MSVTQGTPNAGSADIKLIQFAPDNIPIYLVQETDLIMISKGGDILAQQIAILACGAALGSMPGAFVAVTQVLSGKPLDVNNLVALLIAIAGLVTSIACWCVYSRQKTYPEKLLEEILARKRGPAAGPLSN